MPAPRSKILAIQGLTPHGYQATGGACSAVAALAQLSRLGPGRQNDGRLLAHPTSLARLLPTATPQHDGWSFHQGQDGSGLLARPTPDGLLTLAPIALRALHDAAPRTAHVPDWIAIARDLPPCGVVDDCLLPWFEAFTPSSSVQTAWSRWCRGWLVHAGHKVHHRPLPPEAYIAVQGAQVDHTGRRSRPRVVAHADVHPDVVGAMGRQLDQLIPRMGVHALLHQRAAPLGPRMLLGTSQRCPPPTTAHGQTALVHEALHNPLAATMSLPDTAAR